MGFAAKHIGEAFARVPGMELVRELRTPVYRVQLFRRSTGPTPRRQAAPRAGRATNGRSRRSRRRDQLGRLRDPRTEAANAWMTRALPILLYHRIAEDGPAELAPYQVAPALFDRQLAYLRRHGYRTVTIGEWVQVLADRDGRIDDRVVALTFDDAYRDFIRCLAAAAQVQLRRHRLRCHGPCGWACRVGPSPWRASPDLVVAQLRALAAEGLEIGAHGGAHPFMTQLAPADMLAEGRRSKERLERELGRPVVTMAYPYGDNDLLVRRAMAACGFAGAVTTAPGLSRLGDNPMAIPDTSSTVPTTSTGSSPSSAVPNTPLSTDAYATAMSAGPART